MSASITGPFGDNGKHQEMNVALEADPSSKLIGAANQLSSRSQICFTAKSAG